MRNINCQIPGHLCQTLSQEAAACFTSKLQQAGPCPAHLPTCNAVKRSGRVPWHTLQWVVAIQNFLGDTT